MAVESWADESSLAGSPALDAVQALGTKSVRPAPALLLNGAREGIEREIDISESDTPDWRIPMQCHPVGRLLIVDDEEHITDAVNDYFTILGYLVDCAQDGKSACDLLDLFDYAAVITDLRLSADDRIEGLGVVECVRVRQPLAACIVLTAFGDVANEAELRRRGADALLLKPAPLRLVAEKLAEILNGPRARPQSEVVP